MPLLQEEIEKRLEECNKNFRRLYETHDSTKMLEIFHKDAVIIERDKRAIYGHDGIKELYDYVFTNPPDYEIKAEKSLEAGDGEYLIQEGKMTCHIPDGAKTFPFLFVFKRMEDGSYKLYRDEFSSVPLEGGSCCDKSC